MFLGNDIFDSETEIGQTICELLGGRWETTRQVCTFGSGLETNVKHSIVESSAHQEFEGEICKKLAQVWRKMQESHSIFSSGRQKFVFVGSCSSQ